MAPDVFRTYSLLPYPSPPSVSDQFHVESLRINVPGLERAKSKAEVHTGMPYKTRLGWPAANANSLRQNEDNPYFFVDLDLVSVR